MSHAQNSTPTPGPDDLSAHDIRSHGAPLTIDVEDDVVRVRGPWRHVAGCDPRLAEQARVTVGRDWVRMETRRMGPGEAGPWSLAFRADADALTGVVPLPLSDSLRVMSAVLLLHGYDPAISASLSP